MSRYAYSVPAKSASGLDLLAVAQPISVPTPKCGRVMHANSVDTFEVISIHHDLYREFFIRWSLPLDFKASSFQTANIERQRRRSIRTRKYVRV